MNQLVCGVCGKIKSAHEEMAHEFDIHGELIPKSPVKAVSGIDVALRLLLVDKGIITVEELTLKEAAIREQLAQAQHSSRRSNASEDHGNRAKTLSG